MVWPNTNKLKGFLTLFLISTFLFSIAQHGYTINVQLPNNQPTHEDPGYFETEVLVLPAMESEQAFIALSAKVATDLSSDYLSLWFRTKSEDDWSEWMLMPSDVHQNEHEQALFYNPNYLDPKVKAVQVKCTSSLIGPIEAEQIDLRVFYPGKELECVFGCEQENELEFEREQEQEGGQKSLNCSCPQPSIEFRNDWCPSGNCPQDQTPTPTTVTHLVVHHSAGSNTSPDWAATVRSIWDYHVNIKLWDDIGYNYLIDPNGIIYEGRGNDVQGAHFSCVNSGTMGVCLLGNYDLVGPSNAIINSLTELLGWKACDIDQDPRDTSYFANGGVDLLNLVGHRDDAYIPASCSSSTACPGNNVYAIMNNLRNSVYSYSQTCSIAPSYSNLVVMEMGTFPDTVYKDSSVFLNVVFRNSGAADINENLSIDFRIDNQSIGAASFNALNAGQSDNRQVPYIFSNTGLYDFCAYIDAASNEINTGNNSFCVSIEVIEKADSTISSIAGVADSQLRIFPNPSEDLFWIESEIAIEEMIVYSSLGQEIIRSKTSPIDLGEYAPGIYYLKITFGVNRGIQQYKMVKQ